MRLSRHTATAIVMYVLSAVSLPSTAEGQKRCKKGIPCGGACISASRTCRIGSPSPEPASADKPASSPPTQPTSDSSTKPTSDTTQAGSTKVWINIKSRVYHCPGTRYFGATASGKYSTEREAIAAGIRGANGRRCDA